MSILYIDKTEVTDKTVADIVIPEPSFKDELIEWIEDNYHGIAYSLGGLYIDDESFVSREDAYIEDTYKVEIGFKSKITPRIRVYLKSLVKDIEDQALKSGVNLAYTHWEQEETTEEIIRCSDLPQSVVDFWKATGVEKEYIKKLIALVRNPDIAKFIYVDDCSYDDIGYGSLNITSNYEVAKRYFESVQSDIEGIIQDADDIQEDYKWHECGALIANSMGHKFFYRYIIEDSGHDLGYYKDRLVVKFADEVIKNADRTKQDIIETIRRSCWFYRGLHDDINGYMYLKHDIIIPKFDDESKEVTEYIKQIADDLYEDVLLGVLQKLKTE